MELPIILSGHIIGLLKEYMHDLVEQADQEMLADERFGFTPPPYGPENAIADLLALLDDRIESEGVQVGLPGTVLHSIWGICNQASARISERVWLESNLESQAIGKARTREITYRALIDFIETHGQIRS